MHKKLRTILRHIFPGMPDALFIATLIAISMQGPSLLNGDGDLGRHITIGNYIVSRWKIPTQDIFSHTMTGRQLVPHEWLAQVVFSGVHAWMGLTGIVLLTASLIATTFLCVYRQTLKRDVFRILALVVTLLAAYTSSLHWLTRPHIFTFLLTALWAYQLENEKSKIWWFPLLMLVWANTHGAFIAGFVIWGAHLLGWFWEYLHKQSNKEAGVRLALIGVTSFATTLINPAGWNLWGTSVGYFGNQFLVDQTIEYQSPNFHNWSTWPFLMMLALYILAIGLGGKPRAHEAVLMAGWTVMSLYSARNIPLFAIIAAPYLGAGIQATIASVPTLQRFDQSLSQVEGKSTGILLPLLAIITLGMAYRFHPSPANQFDPKRFPVQAVDWLEEKPQQGKMFNNFIWGGYLLYRMWPEQTVFIDGQTDFYGEALTREYTQVMSLVGDWETILAKYDVAWVIVQSDKPLVKGLQEKMSWVVVYRDDTATILRKP